MKVLLVDDDARLAASVADGLAARGIDVTVATEIMEGRRAAALNAYDVIVLDVVMPGGSGIDLCARLRDVEGDDTPILMLTARDAVDDRVRGLEAGADDYLTKPFAFRELVARLKALARRVPGLLPERVTVADLEANLANRSVTRGGREISLTNKEWDLLEFFLRKLDHVVGRAEITAYVWDENHDPFSNALEVLVSRLRAKIDADGEPLIHTIRGAGYRFGP
ncbi:MAG: response regulator transcription factor [Gemmatimonadales bacterium]|jgi:two-component system copper resistance phosphate regulon response regulator CusR